MIISGIFTQGNANAVQYPHAAKTYHFMYFVLLGGKKYNFYSSLRS